MLQDVINTLWPLNHVLFGSKRIFIHITERNVASISESHPMDILEYFLYYAKFSIILGDIRDTKTSKKCCGTIINRYLMCYRMYSSLFHHRIMFYGDKKESLFTLLNVMWRPSQNLVIWKFSSIFYDIPNINFFQIPLSDAQKPNKCCGIDNE